MESVQSRNRTEQKIRGKRSALKCHEGLNANETSSSELRSAVDATTSSLRDVSSELATQIKDAANSTVSELDSRLSNVESQIEKLDEHTRRPLWLRLLTFK